MKKKGPHPQSEQGLHQSTKRWVTTVLGQGNVLGLVAFRPLFDLELYHLSLRQ